ncbi:helix-turn-helix transcriptional regulator [Bacillus sp. Cr_A10]|uniref:helix-turn-helix domain-containing protein n=1 Tax=Bacillus sp. Cr_A10 TaxID=3033993 RepID=UPI0023DAA7F4|nr:helix-turn-helix transcriptional regulator [Bacillus sp. Cr_A10]MDF2068227.1 helix-turn-helix transcriptional regulator [Bacillus sp. Cr_A10]
MQIGSLIKYHRTKKGITQRELAMGICSIPHLSKIENNAKDANKETLRLLLERLEINLQDVEKSEQNIRHLLKEFLDYIQFYEKDKITEAFNQLENYVDIIVFTDYAYVYELYRLRYYVFIRDFNKAEEQSKWLQAQKQNFSQHEEYLFTYFKALFLVLRGRYEEGDELLTRLVQTDNRINHLEGEFYYHLGLVKGHLHQHSQAIFYGKKSLESYYEEYNLKRILHVMMMLAINYSRAELYDEALEIYSHLLRNAEMFNQIELLPHIYNNIGDLHDSMANHSIALAYFKKSVSLMSKDTDFYLLSLYNLAYTEYKLGLWEDSKDSFELLKAEATQMRVVHFRLFATFYLLLLSDQEVKAMDLLENKILPSSSKLAVLIGAKEHYSSILANYYKREGKFEKAVQYIDKGENG